MLPRLTLLVGLALAASPVLSQDYIDLEAERKAAASAEVSQPAPVTPSEPAAPVAAAPVSASPAEQQSGQNLGELMYQLQLLQQEVMNLRGQVEEQGHQLRQLKQQSLERYLDLDKRLGAGAVATSPDASKVVAATAVAAKPSVTEIPGETEAYKAAYGLVRSQRFDDAIAAFDTFLQSYPDGRYAANAHYWLGELYLVITPQDLEASRQAFTLLLREYPDNSKVPDALYKLGKVYFLKGNSAKSREYLERVIAEFGDSDSSAVKLAKDFLAENF
ncbi:tol-pal system protein YbgF [Halieaceae bacterium IMCC14734]|uniref:Cell division coordinator CpoB n=1 Tax=Candidatus Litorirhabdus singularis TaxID=2518993 RepID=A0ABT3TCW7_9GAMM|nr:tol-pal system protein YbgF [Candidatus Litorirhabdus singularis]MCX2979322.1 tol-pal system protein YbgF [Candidatus Litorirhabdus singularis]